jgi:soluble lytic murein transglycosylase-like protein
MLSRTLAFLTVLALANPAFPENSYTNVDMRIPTAIKAPAKRKRAIILTGAKEIYTYAESAHKTLEPRVALVQVTDPYTRQKVTAPLRIDEVIVRHARLQGIDPLIVEIIIGHESAFNAQATSKVGACGLMQLMPETAAALGVTDITDPEQNIAAGCRYFAEQYRRYGNLHLALAAYNAGPTTVDTFGGVPPYEETLNYCCSIATEYQNRRKKL